MKIKMLSWVLVASVASTVSGVLHCTCVFAAGRPGISIKQTVGSQPHCHENQSKAPANANSNNACCGNCRLEKAALDPARVQAQLNHSPSFRSGTEDLTSILAGQSLFLNQSSVRFEGPPGHIFITQILTQALASRAPPGI